MSCFVSPHTGQPSELASLLQANLGEDRTIQIMTAIYSQEFAESKKYDVEKQGEPSYDWVMENLIHPDLVKLSTPESPLKMSTGEEGKFLRYLTNWNNFSANTNFTVHNSQAIDFKEKLVSAFGAENVRTAVRISEDSVKFDVAKPQFAVESNIKPGVQELFESNPELANAVYEALGFKLKTSENEITRGIKEVLPYKVIGDYSNIEEGLIGRKQYETKIGDDTYVFEISNYNYENEDGTYQSYYDIDFTVNGSEELVGTGFFDKSEKAKQIIQAIISQNFGNDTIRFNVEESKKGKQRLLLYKRLMSQLGYNPSDEMEYALFYNANTYISPSDKIIFGHPTIGKSFLKKQGENKFITLDDDYANEVNAFVDANRGSETRQEYKGRKPKEYNEFMLNLYDRLKVQAKKEGKILFISNTNILKERMSDFDRVITIPKDEFKKRFDARGATYGFEDWKSDIDATVAKVPSNKVISTTGYLSDLFEFSRKINLTPQQKQQAQQLYSQYLESLNKPNTNPILQNNQQEQVKKFAELQERLNNKEFLEGAKNAFESSEELQQFGTQEQYNDYIAKVSLGIVKNPSSGEYNYTSKVKDIVYHGSPKTKLEKIGGISFWTNEMGNAYAYNIQRNEDNSEGFVTSAIVNIKNPYIHQENINSRFATITPNDLIIAAKSKNADGAIWRDVEDIAGRETQTVVFEPEQIHILGSKQDIEGFKGFVNKNNIKEGVSELFESNPELANAVYEALGFVQNKIQPKGTINVYWGLPESESSTRILSNLAPRKFNYKSTDDITREYGSVEHAYQSNKSGTFNKKTYDDYNSLEEIPNRQGKGWGRKIAPKVSVEQMKAADSLGLMKKLVIESFKQNPNSEEAKKLLQYENFTHNTNELIDKAFLEGLKLAQQELLNKNQITPEQKQEAQQLYSQYLDTIFPDSKVTEINDSLYNSVLNQLEQEGKIEKDCSGGKLKAKDGIRGKFTKGSQWEIVKDLKGYPSHSQGGVDVKIGKNGFSFTRDNGVIEAKYGLVLPKIK